MQIKKWILFYFLILQGSEYLFYIPDSIEHLAESNEYSLSSPFIASFLMLACLKNEFEYSDEFLVFRTLTSNLYPLC